MQQLTWDDSVYGLYSAGIGDGSIALKQEIEDSLIKKYRPILVTLAMGLLDIYIHMNDAEDTLEDHYGKIHAHPAMYVAYIYGALTKMLRSGVSEEKLKMLKNSLETLKQTIDCELDRYHLTNQIANSDDVRQTLFNIGIYDNVQLLYINLWCTVIPVDDNNSEHSQGVLKYINILSLPA